MGNCGSFLQIRKDSIQHVNNNNIIVLNQNKKEEGGDEHSNNQQLNQQKTSMTTIKVCKSDFINENFGNIKDQYTFLDQEIIGRGAYGQVTKAIHNATNSLRAIKIIVKQKTRQDYQQRLLNEVKILKNLDHPNILKIYEFFQDEKLFYIVTEYCDGGELFEKIVTKKHFTEREAANIMKQLFSAVAYCHANNIAHRDLKPENIVYETKKDSAELKIIDFGTSIQFNEKEFLTKKLGTLYYIAPEVLKKKYTQKCDI